MSVARWARRHARWLLLVLAVLVAGGVASAWSLPVALFPRVTFPRLQVNVEAGDRPAQRMLLEVTRPVEEALRAIPGVLRVRSTTSRGSAEASVSFAWGEDMVAAMLQAESQLSRLLPSLPPGTTFNVRRTDPTVFPAIAYSLTSDTRSLVELRDAATYELRPPLSAVAGVAKVEVQGGAVEEIQVLVDPAKLQSFGMTLGDVAKSLSAANVLTAVGRLEDRHKLYLVVSDTRLKTLEEIEGAVLRWGANGVVRVDDVATVTRTTSPRYWRVTADGHDAVLLLVYQQPGSSTVQLAAQIRATLAAVRGRLPPGVRVASWYDQSELILASEASVRDAVVVGVGLAAVVLLAFLRSLRVMLIAIIAVPAVLAATVLLLFVLRMSFDIMTLGGMAAAVGLIIDDAIVMLEHIVRRLQDGAGDERGRVLEAASELARPLLGSSASTIIVFAPLAFLSGVTGAFFKALSITMAAALFLSLLVAWLAIPVLAGRLLGAKEARRRPGATDARARRTYERVARGLLARAWLVLLFLLPLFGLAYLAYARVPSGFLPAMDEGGFILDYVAPPGTSLTETDRMLRQVEAVLLATPEVETYSRRTGLGLGGGLTEANQGDLFIRLKPFPRRPIGAVMDEVRARVVRSVPALKIETAQLMEDLIGDLTAVPQPVEIKLFSDDERVLAAVAPAVADTIAGVPGVVEVKTGIVLAGDTIDLRVARVRAALEGMDPDAITTLLEAAVRGDVTTSVERGLKLVDVRVWLPRDVRATELDLGELRLRAPDGHLVPLKRVATITAVTGEPEIMREDLQRMVAVTGRISGRDLGSTVREVDAALARAGVIPGGVRHVLGGLYEQQRIAFRGLLFVLVAALVLVFLLLLFLYERLRVAIAMLVISLSAIAAVLVGLWLTGTELDVTSIMGMTMIVGIVTEVSIFYVSEYEGPGGRRGAPAAPPAPVAEPDARERLVRAGADRMRAVAMTTIAAILALLPLALGVGHGSAMLQPLAIAVVSGLLVQLPLVLLALPALLVLLRATR